MIVLVEGATRQKTPNEIALHILLVGLTIIFSLPASRWYRWRSVRRHLALRDRIIALLVCLIPTTIGGLLSAIGIAGMDRLFAQERAAMSGRGVRGGLETSTPCCSTRPHDHARQP